MTSETTNDVQGTCQHCKFFALVHANKTFKTVQGDCRRHPPRAGGFLLVAGTDWCGEFEPHERNLKSATPSKK